MKLFKSEWRKLTYSRSTYGLILAAAVLASIGSGVMPYVINKNPGMGFGTLADSNIIDSVYGKAAGAYIFALILGVLLMAGEFRHGTAVATFLAAPKRSHVFVAKISLAAIAGALMQLIATGIGMITAAVVLSFYDNVGSPTDTMLPNTLLAAVISGAVLAVLGVAVGTLLRNQMIGVVSVLIWMFIVEPILIFTLPDIGKWSLTGAISGMLALNISSPRLGVSTDNYLDPVSAAFLLLGYGAVFSVAALLTTLRRDID